MTVADEQLVDSPPPQPPLPPRPRPSLSPFGWGSPPEEETPSPEELLQEAATAREALESHFAGEDESSDEDSEWSGSGETSSPASFAEKPTQLASKAQLRQTARAAVRIGGGMAHTVGAKSPEAKHVGLYLTDEEDEAAIGNPLADLFYAKGDVLGGKLSPEANSALQAFMGFAGYVTKQVTRVGEIRELQRHGLDTGEQG